MSYIGRGLQAGAFRQLDDISSGFDGSDATHTMQVNSVDVTVGDVNQILLSLGGVVQKPGTDFTVASSVITFTTAPAANTSFFAILLGSDNGGTVTPTDASVTGGKLASDIAITTTGAANLNGGITMGGTTPTLTVGDAGAEDAKIVFDGNAQDFHIGLDDSADDLVIGVGSALGTTTAISITEDKAVTIGEAGIASSVAGIPFFSDTTNGSIYTHDVSGTDSTAQYNTAYGLNALDAITTSDMNTAVGYQAGSAVTTGDGNVLVGHQAGLAVTGAGAYNVCLGTQAGLAITTGVRNTMVGQAGYGFDTENDNLAIGHNALSGSVAGGEFNVAVGNFSLDAVTSGDNNVAIGYYAGTDLTGGGGVSGQNSLIGSYAGGDLTTGYQNVCVGHRAGYGAADSVGTNPITGARNILIGQYVNTTANNADHGIALGYAITVAANDFSFGKHTSVVTNDFDADADWSRSSDVRLKRNIEDTTLGLDFINDLRPVKFQWKPSNEVPEIMTAEYSEENKKNLDYISHGFIAQEVKEAIDKHGDQTFGGWHLDKTDNETQRVKKNMFVMPLIKAVQELSAKVKALEDA